MKALSIALGVSLLVSVAGAQTRFNQSLAQMKIDQKLGAQVPADATFKDETGKQIQFASLFGRRPIVLLPMFYLCRGVCGKETDNLLKTIARMEGQAMGEKPSEVKSDGTNLSVGKDFDVVFLSINPKETPELAMNKKLSLLKVMKGDTNREGYHFLTGKMEDIRKVTNAVGFGFDYDESDGRINHPAGLMILTPGGKVTQYITGAEYPKPVLTEAISLAHQNKVGKIAEVELLGCVMIDPITGERSIVIEGVIRLVSGIFAIGVFAWIVSMILKNRHRDSAPNGGSPTRA